MSMLKNMTKAPTETPNMTANIAARATAPSAWTAPVRHRSPQPTEARPAVRDFRVPLGGLSLEASAATRIGEEESVVARLVGPEDAPVCAVLGGISAGRVVSDTSGEKGWWPSQVGPGRTVDTAISRVLSFEWFSPAATGVSITPADQARVLERALDVAGIERLDRLVGASYGAMVGIQFACLAPERLGHLTAISGAHRPHPLATAWRAIQRRIVTLASEGGDPRKGVELARALAMTTYRSPDEFAERFDGPADDSGERLRFPVEDYLDARGRDFAERFSAERFQTLSESIDLQDARPETGTVPAVFAGVCQDLLVPPAQMEELARRWAGPARLILFDSVFGHDAFLKADVAIAAVLGDLRGACHD